MRLPLAVLCVLASAGFARAQDDTPSLDQIPHIAVIGTAATSVVPDQAEIRVGVTVQKPTAAEAWEEDARHVKAVIDAAKMAGIKPQDIATVEVSLFQQQDSVRQADGTTRTEIKGYQAVHELKIRVADLERIGSLTGTLIDKGADQFGGVSFSLAHPEPLQDKLRADALRDARHQAELLAAAGGVRLGRLLSIERPDRQAPVRPMAKLRAAGSPTMEVEPGTQTLAEEIEASWAID